MFVKENYDFAIEINTFKLTVTEKVKEDSEAKKQVIQEKETILNQLATEISQMLIEPRFQLKLGIQFLQLELSQTEVDRFACQQTLLCMKEAMERCSQISKFLDPLVESKVSYIKANLVEWLDETITNYQGQQALLSGINLQTNCDLELNNIQLNIPGHLKDVLINLLDNALDSMLQKQKESGSNYVPTITISASYLSEEQKTAITITHNGLEIDPLLLEAFTSTKPNVKEMGLGLYSSKKIIELYKGSLFIEADCAEGASFKITIPTIKSDSL